MKRQSLNIIFRIKLYFKELLDNQKSLTKNLTQLKHAKK